MQLHDRVTIRGQVSLADETVIALTGTVTHVWGKPEADPYVTVRTDDGRTYVRCTSRVVPAESGQS